MNINFSEKFRDKSKQKVCKRCNRSFPVDYFPNKRLLMCNECVKRFMPQWRRTDGLGLNIDKVNKEAMEHGMTYGKYVAVMYQKMQRG